MSDPMTTETAEMFLRRAERAEGRIDGLMRKCVENAVRAYEAEAERDAYRTALEEIARLSNGELIHDPTLANALACSVLAGVVSTRAESAENPDGG